MGLTLHPAYPPLVTSPFTYRFGRGLHFWLDNWYSNIIVALVFLVLVVLAG
jgi:hypothetical protein